MKEVNAFIETIKPYFFMEQYELEVTNNEKPNQKDKNIFADISTRHDYLDADLTIYPLFWGETSKQQKATIIHELCHIVTSVQGNRMWELMNGRHMTRDEYYEVWEKENNWWERIMRKLLADKVDLS